MNFLKTFALTILDYFASLACAVAGSGNFKKIICRFLDVRRDEEYTTFHVRPKRVLPNWAVNDSVKKEKRLAVILQGPLILKDDFTLETLRIYKHVFHGHAVVLSTWEGESSEVIEKARELGVDCVLNPKPLYAGVSNINYQIVSSRAGVRRARELGAEYAFKTRTDQRIYAPDVAEYLYNLVEAFPVSGNHPRQRKRIVGVSLNTFKYRMYGLSDMMIYGHMDDISIYWDIPTDDRVFTPEQLEQSRRLDNTLASFSKWRVCEVYLATEFLKKIGREIRWTLADSWKAYEENFCVVDKEQLDIFWPKYTLQEYRWRSYQQNYKTQEMTFRDWFNIYRGLSNREINEDLLNI